MADGGRPEPTFSWKIGDQKIAPHIVSTDANRLGSQVGDIGHIVSTYTNRLGSEMNYRPLEDRLKSMREKGGSHKYSMTDVSA